MDMLEIKPIVLIWWNTSLSPPTKPRASEDKRNFIKHAVKEFFNKKGVDILALGEVSSLDLEEIKDYINDSSIILHDATGQDKYLKFNIGVLFKKTRLRILYHKSFLDSYGKITLKLCEYIKIYSRDSESVINIYVSHWPSRLHCPENSPKRIEIGTALRQKLDVIRKSSSDPQFIILMGDYNDDPYSISLAEHLLATRDRELAQKNDSFLYNPFWRYLGESEPFLHGKTEQGICGTYYYASGQPSRWYTFDQIMFSSAFLKEGPLTLDERYCQILRNDYLESAIKSSESIFDHLPVMGAINIRRIT